MNICHLILWHGDASSKLHPVHGIAQHMCDSVKLEVNNIRCMHNACAIIVFCSAWYLWQKHVFIMSKESIIAINKLSKRYVFAQVYIYIYR